MSVLHASVCGDSAEGVLGVFSLSKRSNLAGYRSGFVTGDPVLMRELLLVCRQAGLIVPGPVQAAMTAALLDDAHAAEQKARYAARRAVLAAGLTAAGFRIDHSEAGLYLWATRPGLDCWAACELLATECGILAGPGSMYGPAGRRTSGSRSPRPTSGSPPRASGCARSRGLSSAADIGASRPFACCCSSAPCFRSVSAVQR